mmetsp:Transcript_33954/g.82331  ORF Transcript_33954/g.82331 Transcript_33954/m.82331 type:complete len:385 (-) Transcript_33954:582-1736(-)
MMLLYSSSSIRIWIMSAHFLARSSIKAWFWLRSFSALRGTLGPAEGSRRLLPSPDGNGGVATCRSSRVFFVWSIKLLARSVREASFLLSDSFSSCSFWILSSQSLFSFWASVSLLLRTYVTPSTASFLRPSAWVSFACSSSIFDFMFSRSFFPSWTWSSSSLFFSFSASHSVSRDVHFACRLMIVLTVEGRRDRRRGRFRSVDLNVAFRSADFHVLFRSFTTSPSSSTVSSAVASPAVVLAASSPPAAAPPAAAAAAAAASPSSFASFPSPGSSAAALGPSLPSFVFVSPAAAAALASAAASGAAPPSPSPSPSMMSTPEPSPPVASSSFRAVMSLSWSRILCSAAASSCLYSEMLRSTFTFGLFLISFARLPNRSVESVSSML